MSSDGFTFGGWKDDPEYGDIFRLDITPITFNLTLYAVWIENVPVITDEAVSDSAPTVGETEVDMSSISIDTRPENLEALMKAAQSVQLPEPESVEEQVVRNTAMQSAVDSIDEIIRQRENQSAMAALIAAGLILQNEDGAIPENTEIEVSREVYMEVQAKGLVEQNVDGVVRKLLSLDINPFYNVLANVAGSAANPVSVSGGNPTTIEKPIDLSVGLPVGFLPDGQNFAYVNHQHDGIDYTYRGSVSDGTLSFRSLGLSPFEITTDSMAAKITVNADGTAMDLYYATLADAVQKVENGGTITLVEGVTESLTTDKNKSYTVELASGVNEADVNLTVDGKTASFQNGKVTVAAASEPGTDPAAPGTDPSTPPTDPATPGTDTPTTPGTPAPQPAKQGCYVATAVYGSYDCPEVWTLRRFRDKVLAKTWYGRLFIKLYYAVSPTAVRLFGNCAWFQNFFRDRLDVMVGSLQENGFESTPYNDRTW